MISWNKIIIPLWVAIICLFSVANSISFECPAVFLFDASAENGGYPLNIFFTASGEENLPLMPAEKTDFFEGAEGAAPPTNTEEKISEYSIWKNEWTDGFHYLFKTVLSFASQQPSDSTQNPNNNFLQIPRYVLQDEIRPDFSYTYHNLNLSIEPRYTAYWNEWKDGSPKGQNLTSDEAYVNEWLASCKLFDNWVVSYGRENLQWGPAYFISPSNPFFRDNGLSNPIEEVRGMDFARSIWVINSDWSVSLIENTGEGAQNLLYEFERTYAAKLDYTAFQKYGSLIASYTDNDRFHLGALGGYTIMDGLLVYAEGSVSAGTNDLYPQYTVLKTIYPQIPLPSAQFIQMGPFKEDSSDLEGILLLGESYTFETSQTIGMEYVYNGPGYSSEEAGLYYKYRKNASLVYGSDDPLLNELAQKALLQTVDPKLRLLRKNYIMIRYQDLMFNNKLSMILRFVQNLDDASCQIIPFLGYDIGDHTQLYLTGAQNMGGSETEYGSIAQYGLTIGVEYTF